MALETLPSSMKHSRPRGPRRSITNSQLQEQVALYGEDFETIVKEQEWSHLVSPSDLSRRWKKENLQPRFADKGLIFSENTEALEELIGDRGFFAGGRQTTSAVSSEYLDRILPTFYRNTTQSRMRTVSNQKNLKYSLCEKLGFTEGFATLKLKVRREYAVNLQVEVERELRKNGFLSKENNALFRLSMMQTRGGTCKQAPHIDFESWSDVTPGSGQAVVSSYQAAPIVGFFPLTREGMYLEIWPERTPENPIVEGRMVFVRRGELLILRGDVVHAGAFSSSLEEGNPRCHLYIWKIGDVGWNGYTDVPMNLYRDVADESLLSSHRHCALADDPEVFAFKTKPRCTDF